MIIEVNKITYSNNKWNERIRKHEKNNDTNITRVWIVLWNPRPKDVIFIPKQFILVYYYYISYHEQWTLKIQILQMLKRL